MELSAKHGRFGRLAKLHCGVLLELEVCQSAAGFYIGTSDEEGPCSRELVEYFPTREFAENAMRAGDWTQRTGP
ncbi:hypothetical protein [Cupriavidus malaysiensis]|uniref:Uncharacterized protein n=1 Tax=Cupriavidus malaysiensis TaxID=367825 RepID=A0ABN4U1F1_9BURK|nr:hypothetical protein [Cupriavidus malaysiensis]AOZ11119.1 hypothetical protein BKK80_34750 [Cupriavidus malaysiensis]